MKLRTNPKEDIRVVVLSDGTTTEASVISGQGTLLGEGVAKRRKGETRDDVLGTLLATQRAFEAAAEKLKSWAVDRGYVEEKAEKPAPYVALVDGRRIEVKRYVTLVKTEG